jgi:hypothetical protein
VAVFHRVHTSGFCSALQQLSHSVAFAMEIAVALGICRASRILVKRQAPWANGVHGAADGGATSVTASFDMHLLLQLISADPFAAHQGRCDTNPLYQPTNKRKQPKLRGVRYVQPVLCHLRRHFHGLYPRADSRRRARGRQRGHLQVRLASLLHFLAPAPLLAPSVPQ